MKKALCIVLLVLMVILIALPLVNVRCAPSTAKDLMDKAEEKGFDVTDMLLLPADEEAGMTDMVIISYDNDGKISDLAYFYFFDSKDAAKAFAADLTEISPKAEILRDGAVVFAGTGSHYVELTTPAPLYFAKTYLKVNAVPYLIFVVFLIATLGYLLGRVTIKGVSLGTAGVFLVALLFGCLFYGDLSAQLPGYTTNALKVVENLGLILFVSSVGFIAGPKFFGNLKKNFKTYILLGLIIILSGAVICGGCILLAKATMKNVAADQLVAIMTGLFSGALTSTPAFSASKAAVGAALEDYVAVGNGIAYIFGVIGVVLFVQLVPKFMKADMAAERAKLATTGEKKSRVNEDGDEIPDESVEEAPKKPLINIDGFGIAAFALASILGVLIGSLKFGNFSLTTTGGCLLVALVFGHFAKCGRINLMPPATTLKVFRELGLMLFLIGAGVAGGAKFVECFEAIYFVYGALMTILPMCVGFLFAKFVLKMNLLNSLGSITGGMTSTPALGTLIQVSGTEDVGSSYAATYPIALISVVLCSQFLIMIFL